MRGREANQRGSRARRTRAAAAVAVLLMGCAFGRIARAETNDLNPRPLGMPSGARVEVQRAGSGDGPGATTSEAGSDLSIVKAALSLGGVLALMLVLGAVARRMLKANPGLAAAFGGAGQSPAGILEVLGRYPLGRGQTLVLLKLDRRVLLLAQSAARLRGGVGGVTTLCEVCEPDDVASILLKVQEAGGDSHAARFKALLENFDTRHGAEEGGDGVVEVASERGSAGMRRVRATPEGDRAELWDDRAAAPERVAPVMQAVEQPALRLSGGDAFAELRDRLAVARTRQAAGGRR